MKATELIANVTGVDLTHPFWQAWAVLYIVGHLALLASVWRLK